MLSVTLMSRVANFPKMALQDLKVGLGKSDTHVHDMVTRRGAALGPGARNIGSLLDGIYSRRS
jgi:hypothetical protein